LHSSIREVVPTHAIAGALRLPAVVALMAAQYAQRA
jgi:hypothetical protein